MKKHVKMKRIISFILAFITIIQYVPKDNIVFASNDVGSVTYNGRTTTYSSVKSLWKAATSHGSSAVTVDLLKDWNTGDKNDVNSSLTVPSKADITINLNGHMIDRDLVNKSQALSKSNKGYGSGQSFGTVDTDFYLRKVNPQDFNLMEGYRSCFSLHHFSFSGQLVQFFSVHFQSGIHRWNLIIFSHK